MRSNRAIVLSCLAACSACSQTGGLPSSLPAAADIRAAIECKRDIQDRL